MKIGSKKRIAAIIGACILLAALAVAVLLHTPPVNRYVLSKAADYLRVHAGMVLDAGRLHYNLFMMQVALDECMLRSAANPQLPPLLTVQHVGFRLSLPDLLRGAMPVHDVRLTGVSVHIAVGADGASNLPQLPAGGTTAREPIQIPSLRVSDASFQYEDLQHDLGIHLPRWNLNIEESSYSPGRMNARLDSLQEGTLTLGGQQEVVSRIHLDAEIDGSRAGIRDLVLDTGMARATARGEITLTGVRMDLEMDAAAHLARIASFLGLSGDFEGELALRAVAAGALPGLNIRGQISGEDLSAFGYRSLELAANPVWSGSDSVLNIASLSLRADGGAIRGSARWVPEAGEPSRLRLDLEKWDVQPASAILDLPAELASRATGLMEAEWSGTKIAEVRGKASIGLSPKAARMRRNLVPLTGSMGLSHEAGRTQIDIQSAGIPGLQIRGAASMRNFEALTGSARLDVPDLGVLEENLRSLLGSQYPDIPTPLAGNLGMQARISGTLKQPAAEIELDGRQIRIGAISGMGVQADIAASPTEVLLHDSRLAWGGATLSAAGSLSIAPSQPALNLRARIDTAQIADIRRALQSDLPLTGTIEAQAEIKGPLSNPSAEAEVRIRAFQAYEEFLGDLQAGIGFGNQRLELKRLSIARNSESADAREIFSAWGHYDLKNQSYEVHSEAGALEMRSLMLPGGLSVRGTLNVTASGSGSVSDPVLDAKFDFQNLQVGDSVPGRLHGEARLAAHSLEIGMQAPGLNLTASGTLHTQPPYPGQMEVIAQGTELDRLGVNLAAGTQLRGVLSGRVTAAGNIQDWQQAEGDAQIQELQIAFKDRRITNQGPVQLDLTGGMLHIGQLTLVEKGAEVRIDGSLPLFDRERAGHLNIAGQADLTTAMDFLPPESGISLAGTAVISTTIEGKRDAVRASGTARLRGGSFTFPQLPVPLTQVDADLRVRDGVLLLDRAQGNLEDGTIRASGMLPLGWITENLPVHFEAASGSSRLTLDLAGLSVASIPGIPAGLTGTVGLHAEAEAQEPKLEAVKAELRLEELDLAFDQYRIAQTRPSVIAVDGGVARIERFALSGTGTDLQATGNANLTGDGAIALQVRGQLEAELLTFFSKDLRAGGRIDVRADVGNTFRDPRVTGLLESKNARLTVREPRLQAEDVNFRIQLEGERVSIETLTASLNGGSLKAGGGLRLSGGGIAEVDIQAGATDVALDFPAGLRSALDADLAIRSRDDLIVIGGAANILEGYYKEPLDLEGEVLRYLRSDQTLNLAAEPDPFLSRIRYGIRVDTRESVVVDNNLAKMALDAGLEVTGTYYRPVVTGRITLEEGGEVFLSERTYLVERGIIDLQNPLRIEPSIDLRAKTRVGSNDITLQISGTPDKLTSSLSSDPPYPEPDIVSLLLTGRTLEDAQGAQLNVAKEQALSYLVGRVGSSLSRQAEQTLGLSRVRLEPNLISPESDPGARLTIGENITSGLQLIYSMNLANSQDHIWIAEYKPVPRFDTRVVRQSDGSYRFDFRHDLRFGSSHAPAPSARPRAELEIGKIEFQGNPLLPEEELKQKLALD